MLRTTWRLVVLALVLGGYVVDETTLGAEPSYSPEAGTTVHYRVKISFEDERYADVYEGTPEIEVRTVVGDRVELGLSGHLTHVRRFKQVAGFGGAPLEMPLAGLKPGGGSPPVVVSVDGRGNVLSCKGDAELPFWLGHLGELMIEPLGPKGAQKWSVKQEMSIRSTTGPHPFVPGLSLSPPGLPWASKREYPATEETQFSIEKSDGEFVTIRKTFSLKTLSTVDGKPKLSLSGGGLFQFDTATGMIDELAYKMTIESRRRGRFVSVPVTVDVKRLSSEELRQVVAQEQAEAERAGDPLSPKDLADVLKELRSERPNGALAKLRLKAPRIPNPEVAPALARWLKDEEHSMRASAAAALENWATDEVVPDLVAALDDSERSVVHSTMTALVKLKAKAGIEAIASRLEDPDKEAVVSNALTLLGPAAETAVVKRLTHADWSTRLRATRILTEIGTDESLPPLRESAVSDVNPLVRRAAVEAVTAIEKRIGEVR